MKDRIKMIMESQHMTQQTFAQFIQISPASLSSIFTGRTKPTLAIAEAIKSKLPTLSTDWLLFGSGPMYMTGKSDSESTTENTPQMLLQLHLLTKVIRRVLIRHAIITIILLPK